METKDDDKKVEVNEYQEALNDVINNAKDWNVKNDSFWLIQECINENEALKEVIKGLRNENFVHILTHNGIKYAFQNRMQVNDFVEKNNLSKVHLTSIMYYREKPLDWSKDE